MQILITRFPYESQLSGEEWHTIRLASELKKRKHKIFFAGSCDILHSELKKRGFISKKIWGGTSVVSKKAIIKFFFTAPFIFINFALKLYSLKKKHNINVVYMQSLNEKLLMTPLALILKMNVIWVEHARIGRWLTLNPYLFLYKLWSKYVTIVSVSHQHTGQLKWLKNIKTIVNGIDLQEFKPLRIDKNRFFQKNFKFLKNDEYIIGTVARLYPDKGLKYLINSFNDFQKPHPQSRLTIVGIGPEEENLRLLVNKHGLQEKIAFLLELPRQDIIEYYNAIDCFVLPSAMLDPFGLVAAEAMACKKPVIVTEVCGISDQIKNKVNGLVIPARDSNALTNAIKEIYEKHELSLKIAINGFNLCREKFSIQRMVDEYEIIIKSRSNK